MRLGTPLRKMRFSCAPSAERTYHHASNFHPHPARRSLDSQTPARTAECSIPETAETPVDRRMERPLRLLPIGNQPRESDNGSRPAAEPAGKLRSDQSRPLLPVLQRSETRPHARRMGRGHSRVRRISPTKPSAGVGAAVRIESDGLNFENDQSIIRPTRGLVGT